jgi:hypothetical protein
MKRIKSVLAVAAVMAMMVASALPAAAQSSNGPICQLFLTEGDLGYYPNTSSGGPATTPPCMVGTCGASPQSGDGTCSVDAAASPDTKSSKKAL